MSIGAVILAAGHGTRMRSRRPKVLHPVAGRPMLDWVLRAARDGGVEAVVVVVGPEADDVRAALPAGVEVAVQETRRGTGDAAAIGLRALGGRHRDALILCGDTPLITGGLIRDLLAAHREVGPAATLVSARLADPAAYGRVLRAPDGALDRIVEATDATPEELAVDEINAGIYVGVAEGLARALDGVGTDNAQGEVYLPDALPRLDGPVAVHAVDDPDVVLGINTRVDLAACEARLQDRLRERLMLQGVTMPDPGRVYLDADVEVGRDTVLWPETHLRGATRVGSGCEIGPQVVLTDTSVGDGCVIVAAHGIDSVVGADCEVGPFARLRPGTRLSDGARLGTYVETKNADIGPGAKIPHLSYIGDATIGAGTNIGAGNITANYDGFRKHRTTIGERVKTGSDCVFVAPVEIGDDAMTGAGSIVTSDIPPGALGIARARQSNIEGFTARAAAKAQRAAEADREDA